MIEKLPGDELLADEALAEERLIAARAEAPRVLFAAFGRLLFRFLSLTSLFCAIEIVRRGPHVWPIERRTAGAVIAFGAAGLLGGLILWKSRNGAAREVLESAAMMGFWTGFFALIP